MSTRVYGPERARYTWQTLPLDEQDPRVQLRRDAGERTLGSFRYYVIVDGVKVGWVIRWQGRTKWTGVICEPGQVQGDIVCEYPQRRMCVGDVILRAWQRGLLLHG